MNLLANALERRLVDARSSLFYQLRRNGEILFGCNLSLVRRVHSVAVTGRLRRASMPAICASTNRQASPQKVQTAAGQRSQVDTRLRLLSP
jgi:hypothetical protein